MAEVGFDGRVAIITGAGGGLGLQHAELLASRGAMVVINDIGGSVHGEGGDVGPAERAAKEIEAKGGVAVADTNSVATPEGGQAIVDSAIEAFGRVDIVVNNAGILRDKSFHNLTPDLIDPVIDVHLRGAFNVTRPAWVKMREQGYGRVVNTSSGSGILGNFGQANYGAAKMGLWGFTRVLAQEGAKYNIKTNAIAPVALTRMTEEMFSEMAPMLRAELVSPVVAWLASEGCTVSGEAFSCAGGRIARFFVGLTEGYYNPDLAIEDVAAHIDEIRAIDSLDDFWIPENLTEELAHLADTFGVTGI